MIVGYKNRTNLATNAVIWTKDNRALGGATVSLQHLARHPELAKPVRVKLLRNGHNVWKEVS